MAKNVSSAIGSLDFLVIGAARSGTTAVYEHLRRHPEIFMPAGKELPFFSHEQRYRDGWESFARVHFPTSETSGKICGKASPQYMAGSLFGHEATDVPKSESEAARIIPSRIAAAFPSVKLIAILREPVARAISQHHLASMVGWDPRPLDDAIREDLEPGSLAEARLRPNEGNSGVVLGEYARILDGYLEVFRPDQLLILSYADLRADEAAALRQIYEFIDVDPEFVPGSLGRSFNPSADSRRLGPIALARLRQMATDSTIMQKAWMHFPETFQSRVERAYLTLNYRAFLWNRRVSKAAPEAKAPDPDLLGALENHYVPWNEALRARMGDVRGVTDHPDPGPAAGSGAA